MVQCCCWNLSVPKDVWVSLIILFMSFLGNLSLSVGLTFLPEYLKSHYEMSTFAVSMVFTVQGLASFLVSPAVGYLSVLTGRKGAMLLSLLALGVVTLLFGFVEYFSFLGYAFWIFFIRGIQGLCLGTFLTTMTAYIADQYSNHLGQALSFAVVGAGSAFMVGPVAGHYIFRWLDFKAPFCTLGALMIMTAVWTVSQGRSCLCRCILQCSQPCILPRDKFSRRGLAFDLRVFRSVPLWTIGLSTVVVVTSISYIAPLLISTTQKLLGSSEDHATFLTSMWFILMLFTFLLSAVGSGVLADLFGYHLGLICGLVVSGIALIMLVWPVWWRLGSSWGIHLEQSISMLLLGIGFALSLVPTLPAMAVEASEFSSGAVGVVCGIWTSCFYLGCSLGPMASIALSGWISADMCILSIAAVLVTTVIPVAGSMFFTCAYGIVNGGGRWGRLRERLLGSDAEEDEEEPILGAAGASDAVPEGDETTVITTVIS